MSPESSGQMRIATPCSEDLDAMEKTERGFFCDKCQHDVVDLRRTPRKKALKVLAELRSQAQGAKVCVRVMARPDRTPVFLPDPPSAFARLAAPIALATSLAACAPQSRETTAPVAAAVHETSGGTRSNTNGTGQVITPVVVVAHDQQPQDLGLVSFEPTDMAGGLMMP